MAAQMTARTPPSASAAGQQAEEHLRTVYRCWRRTLHRAKDYRVKVLRALAEDGHAEAAELLNDPPRVYKATRCKLCAGCLLMNAEKACGGCQGCRQGTGCEEHHRRCLDWPRNANTYHGGSEITAISSQFDLLAADMSKYENVIGQLQEFDMEIEEAMDALPPQSGSRSNPRFLPTAREKSLDDERQHASKLAFMLQRHAEVATRLTELDDEEETAATEQQQEVTPDRRLTGTQTSRELINLFNANLKLPQLPSTSEEEGDSLGNVQASESESSDLLRSVLRDRDMWTSSMVRTAAAEADRPIDGTVRGRQVSPSLRAPTPPTTFSTLFNAQGQAPDARVSFRQPVQQPTPTARLPSDRQPTFRLPRPQENIEGIAGLRFPAPSQGTERRRSQSNEFGDGTQARTTARVTSRRLEDRLFELLTWVQTRKDVVATRLISVEETLADSPLPGTVDPDWIRGELKFVLAQLDQTEVAETELWLLLARVQGPNARLERAERWRIWFQQVTAKTTAIQGRLARRESVPVTTQNSAPTTCQRRGGFLERVKLPVFSGSVEDFGEFKTQFQELCRGESFTGVVELAQLRQKLPKDAAALLTGLTTPDEAWDRLDETYGNVDLQALEALKRLRSFKATKSAPHDQVVEIAVAVQRCVTVLRALDRELDFLMDRETVSEVLGCLPADSQQRWYHRKGGRGDTQAQKGRAFLTWLEDERADAVAIRLDVLARRAKPPASPHQSGKPSLSVGGTDKPIYAGTHATLLNPAQPTDAQVHLNTAASGSSASRDVPKRGRIEVTTALQAGEVAAKRKTNLEEKKLDKCPMCQAAARVREDLDPDDASHSYEDGIYLAHELSQVFGSVGCTEASQCHVARRLSAMHVLGTSQTSIWREGTTRTQMQAASSRSGMWWQTRTMVPRLQQQHGESSRRPSRCRRRVCHP